MSAFVKPIAPRPLGTPVCCISEIIAVASLLNTTDLIAASFTPNDGHCTPESVVLGYAGGAKKLGANVITNVEVTGINSHDGEITAVSTSLGEIKTTTVINCAGVWSPKIASMVGLDLPVTPYKRELVITEPLDDSFADLPKEMPMTIDYSSSLYWHREGKGLLMGFSDKTAQPSFDLKKDPQFLEKLGAIAINRAPRLMNVGIGKGWAGLYEVTPDHNAILGEYKKVSRFFYATGFSGHGFLQGPAIGEILRDLYLGQQPFVKIDRLSANRFTTSGQLRPEYNIV